MNIRLSTYESIRDVKEQWESILKQDSQPHTPFQSYLYNKLSYKFVLSRRKYRHYRPLLLVLDGDNGWKAIWALVINIRERKIYNSSFSGPMDYWDIVSNTDDTSFHEDCWRLVQQKYSGYSICLENIKSDYYSGAGKDVQQRGRLLSILPENELIPANCVQIDVKEYEGYFSNLSKHQRQNIRTAYNKIQREGISLQLRCFDVHTNRPSLIDYLRCMVMYEKRSVLKIYKYGGTVPRLSRLNRYYHMIFSASNISYLTMPSRQMYILYANGKPAAYMAGFLEKGIYYVGRLSASPEHAKYDMGIILLDQVMRIANSKSMHTIDLTRGDEPYKLAMGGYIKYNYTYQGGI